MRIILAVLSSLILTTFCGDLQAQDESARKKGVYFGFGAGLGTSYNDYSPNKNPRTVGIAVNSSVNVATRNNHTFGIEFDGYIGYNLNLIIPITIYQDDKHYFKFGPTVCRVGYDFAGQQYGYGFALGGGVDLYPSFINEAAFNSIIVNANLIFQHLKERNTNYFSLTVGIRFSSGS